MLSSLTKSVRNKIHPDTPSPGISHRTITFPENEHERRGSQKQSFHHYRDQQRQRPPRDADHDDDEEEDDEEEIEDEDADDGSMNDAEEQTPLLPIFSAAHLNILPVYSFTHSFREMVVERCDTVLTWDQLRSPQVSQFLVKPIQQDIKENYMNAATQYALLANALQFNKEAGLNPGNGGTNKTRAMLCELIAIKLLRECDTRELIDALSYDFDPLQGQSSSGDLHTPFQHRRPSPKSARISCIEIAIRANAKRFLSHPLVVQHLEAIWNGSIVFHAAADSMHRRRPSYNNNISYGTNCQSRALPQDMAGAKRTATLYNPRDASLFKLSRLRVPRYRNILSTISFAVLLLLFLAVLEARSLEITTLEIIFWVWAGGYMLDEVLGFNDQGFSLYIASFWNTFDLGILLLLFIHLCLRLYCFVVPTIESKLHVAKLAYDVLATSAVLLFPRLFSVLDHYRYFSQLIIAFRMMAADMLAIFVLIIIFCSGFLVALTFAFSHGKADDPKQVAYALLQMLLGFTPAAWDNMDKYNWLGKVVLVLFLFICHFVVVTILITVLTNSFMEIVRNANEEHQYLFAVNVISSVKSDALFAYVPPINVIQWLLSPSRYLLPFRDYIKLNRTIIKATHFPILFSIYLYERLALRTKYVDTVNMVESRERARNSLSTRLPRLIREPSIATFRQEAALEEVFKQAGDETMRIARSQEWRKSSNVVNSWMHNMSGEDAEPPQEQDRKVVDKLERRRLGSKRLLPSNFRDFSISRRPMSVVSDPNDFGSHTDFFSPRGRLVSNVDLTPTALDLPSQQTGADGDDELLTNDNDDDKDTNVPSSGARRDPFISSGRNTPRRDYFSSRIASKTQTQTPDYHDATDSAAPRQTSANLKDTTRQTSPRELRPRHNRNASSATMIYNPPPDSESEKERPPLDTISGSTKYISIDPTVASFDHPTSKPSSGGPSGPGRRTPKRALKAAARPFLPPKENQAFRSVPNMNHVSARSKPSNIPGSPPGKDNPQRRSSIEIDLVSDIGDNKAIGGGYVGALPASFASQMAYATNAMRQSQLQLQREEQERRNNENSEMFGRLMMARMNTLEEGFRGVVHEVREGMKQVGSGLASRQRSPERADPLNVQKRVGREKRFRDRQERGMIRSGSASVVSVGNSERLKTGGSGSGNGSGKEPEVLKGGPVRVLTDEQPETEIGDEPRTPSREGREGVAESPSTVREVDSPKEKECDE